MKYFDKYTVLGSLILIPTLLVDSFVTRIPVLLYSALCLMAAILFMMGIKPREKD